MTSNPLRNGLAAEGLPAERDWLPLAAFVFVILALVALAVTPALLLQRISRVTDDVTTTLLPAYDGMRDFAFAMEQRISSARSRFLTDDPLYDRRLTEARAAEAEALRTLQALAPRLGPNAARHVESLQRHAGRRDSLESALLRAGAGAQEYEAALPQFDALRDSMLVELAGLRQELTRVTEARITEERRWSNLQRWLSVVLGVLAVLAALLVGWFARQQRRLRREVQRALEEANRQRVIAERRGDELERATEARVRLLRGITHDIKNPLGAAKGYAELLALGIKSPLAPQQAPFVEGIQRSVDSALGIIADLLDLARANSGGVSVECVPAVLEEVAREAVDDHRAAAQAAGHSVDFLPSEPPVQVYTDPARVRQVLGNLLSNAIKYTPAPGRITIRTGLLDAEDGPRPGRWAAVQVSDTGPGIPPEQREAIFDEFTRLDDDSPAKGHGLGLAIARRLARLLGGDLNVSDTANGGATFILWLPRSEETASLAEDVPPTSGRRYDA